MANNKTLSERIVDSARTGRSDPTELATLDDVTASAAELNIMDGVEATTAQINAAAAPAYRTITVPNATPYNVLAADSTKIHILPNFSADTTINLPTVSPGLVFEFVSVALAADAQSWIFKSTGTQFLGGILSIDTDQTTTNVDEAAVFPNGSTHNTLTVATPSGGTWLRFISTDAHWICNGYVVSAAVPAFTAV